jgi:hypothetical protein
VGAAGEIGFVLPKVRKSVACRADREGARGTEIPAFSPVGFVSPFRRNWCLVALRDRMARDAAMVHC